jgi:hypothetical protein
MTVTAGGKQGYATTRGLGRLHKSLPERGSFRVSPCTNGCGITIVWALQQGFQVVQVEHQRWLTLLIQECPEEDVQAHCWAL